SPFRTGMENCQPTRISAPQTINRLANVCALVNTLNKEPPSYGARPFYRGSRTSTPNFDLPKVLRFGFMLLAFALGNNSSLEFAAERVWKVVNFVVAVNLDGHLRGVANHIAVMAPLEMLFQFDARCGVHGAV